MKKTQIKLSFEPRPKPTKPKVEEKKKEVDNKTQVKEKSKRKRVIESDSESESEQQQVETKKKQKLTELEMDQDADMDDDEYVDQEEEEEEEDGEEEEEVEEDDEEYEYDEDEEIAQAKKEEKEQKDEKAYLKAAAKTLATTNTEAMMGTWKKGQPIPYSALCETFDACESTTKRLAITANLVKLFVETIKLSDAQGLLELLYMCLNKVCPDYEGKELGIGESFLIKAIAESSGRDVSKVKAEYVKSGDLGLIAMGSKGAQRTLFKPKPLTVNQVFKTLKEISYITGNSSQKKKIDKIRSLLVACQGNEAKFIIRQLEGKLRIGLAEQTVLSALAQSVVLSKNAGKKISPARQELELTNAAETVKYVYNQLPCYDMIIPQLLSSPLDQLLENCTMRPGIPLKPMLAHPTKSLTEVLDRFDGQKFTCEFKYDGERAQIHKLQDGTINVYSRNSENMTERYPDIMQAIEKWLKPTTSSFILDCEAVAWDIEKQTILPFQVLSTRKRKDVKVEDIKVRVAIYAFDCLYLNGQSLLQKPLSERREMLRASFIETENEFYYARHMDSNSIEDIQTFLDVSITSNCEGLMVKSFDSPEATYEPSRRSRNWLKVKKDYIKGVGDSMDLVVIGAFHGHGKRTSVYGAFLLACYDPETEEYQTICKIGTGFSDENLKTFYDDLKPHVIDQPLRYYHLGENPVKPDVWFKPVKVWEIECADLSVSPRYMAAVGMADPSKGISLRFPRFIRIREDKEPDDATSSEQIYDFYASQAQLQ